VPHWCPSLLLPEPTKRILALVHVLVIALVITPEGFPLAYEVLDGNPSDRTTLRSFLDKIESSYGRARRVWVMDRGIPTEAVLQEMRTSDRKIFYLVGTPQIADQLIAMKPGKTKPCWIKRP
jgi:transposase